MTPPVGRRPGARLRLGLAIGVAVAAAIAGSAVLRGGPAVPVVQGCRLAVAVAVPVVEAAPVYLARDTFRLNGRTCRLAAVTSGTDPHPVLAVLPGDGLRDHPGMIPFLLVAQRTDAALVARRRVAPHFLWHDLAEQSVLLPSVRGDLGPVVVEAMIALHHVGHVTVLTGLGRAAFAAGTGTYLELPLWQAERVAIEGRGHIATSLAIQGGPLPAAVLAVRSGFAAAHPAVLASVARAVYTAQLALDAGTAPLARRWPVPLGPTGRRVLAAALAAGRYAQVWPTDPRVEAYLFVRLRVLAQAAGAPTQVEPPAQVIAAPAEAAMRRLAPRETPIRPAGAT